jgi:hypothetical protein
MRGARFGWVGSPISWFSSHPQAMQFIANPFAHLILAGLGVI